MEITTSEFESVMRLVAESIGQVMTREKASEIMAVLRGTNGYPIDHTQFPQEDAGAYTMACEPFARTDEMEALHAAYHAATDDTGEPLNYDYDLMYRLWCVGSMVQFVTREKATGRLVGVMRLYVGRCERTGTRYCKDSMFFIYEQHRGQMALAVGLWRYAERSMFAYGVRKVSFTSLLKPGAEKMAKFLGYQPKGTLFVKTHAGDDYQALTTRHDERQPK